MLAIWLFLEHTQAYNCFQFFPLLSSFLEQSVSDIYVVLLFTLYRDNCSNVTLLNKLSVIFFQEYLPNQCLTSYFAFSFLHDIYHHFIYVLLLYVPNAYNSASSGDQFIHVELICNVNMCVCEIYIQ